MVLETIHNIHQTLSWTVYFWPVNVTSPSNHVTSQKYKVESAFQDTKGERIGRHIYIYIVVREALSRRSVVVWLNTSGSRFSSLLCRARLLNEVRSRTETKRSVLIATGILAFSTIDVMPKVLAIPRKRFSGSSDTDLAKVGSDTSMRVGRT